jgi:hypothetical protein
VWPLFGQWATSMVWVCFEVRLTIHAPKPRVLRSYVEYYHDWRTHLSLEMDTPESRAVQPPELGVVKKVPEVGGLHYHYERIAA